MRYVIFILLILSSQISLSQSKQDYNWLFGRDKSVTPEQGGYIFDFNKKPVSIHKRDNGIGISASNASISDKDGNLIFYTNGCAILDSNSKIITNGYPIVDTVWMNFLNKDCKRGYPGGQNNIILKDNYNDSLYYLINKPRVFNGVNEDTTIPIWYSLVKHNPSSDEVISISRNNVIYDSKNTLSNFLTALPHANGKDWWIIQPIVEDSVFVTFLLAENGFEKYPDQNTHEYFNEWRSSAGGTAKFSPDGTKYALYTFTDQLHIYDFDRETGKLSNHEKIFVFPDPDQDEVRFCSIEWSSNSRFIYTASSLELHQVDTWESNIQTGGIRLIAEWDGTNDPFSNTFYLMAQGPDCKIYMCSTSANNSYHVIKQPNELGIACDFCQSCLPLPETAYLGSMPNFPRFRVDEEEKCDSTIELVLGLPVWYERKLTIYPNPSNGEISIDIPNGIKLGQVIVYNNRGQVIRNIKIAKNHITLDIKDQPDGIYYIEIIPTERRKEKVYYRGKVVKSNNN